jgi:hypothetical protein
LTTDSPASHYGLPVLRIDAADVAGDFGPADLLGDVDRPETLTAAEIVAGWAMNAERNEEELEAARTFLSQWPEGPQI